MKLRFFHVDAFTGSVFSGNPAAVVPLEKWLADDALQNIAFENNLSETAFFVRQGAQYQLRWFTPAREVDLCGHATLATAYVLFNELNHVGEEISFSTRSGDLTVRKNGQLLVMDFPSIASYPPDDDERVCLPENIKPVEVLTSKQDLMVVLPSESDVAGFDQHESRLRFAGHRGLILTARGKDVDFVSRCFYPELNIEEDPVTGSAHCQMAPYWASRLGRNILKARQISRRGGEIVCEVRGDRVILSGRAAMYLAGEIRTS